MFHVFVTVRQEDYMHFSFINPAHIQGWGMGYGEVFPALYKEYRLTLTKQTHGAALQLGHSRPYHLLCIFNLEMQSRLRSCENGRYMVLIALSVIVLCCSALVLFSLDIYTSFRDPLL